MRFFGLLRRLMNGVSRFLLWTVFICFCWGPGPPLPAALAEETPEAGGRPSIWSKLAAAASPARTFLLPVIRNLNSRWARLVPLEDLIAERERLREDIARVQSVYDRYIDRELRPLSALRLEELGLAEALLTRRIAALKSGAAINFESPGWEPRPELAARLAEEIELLEEEMRSAEEEAAKYLGGPLLSELRLVQAQRGFTLALLRRHYLMAKYGLADPAISWGSFSEASSEKEGLSEAAIWQSAGGVWLTKAEEGAASRSIVTFAPGSPEEERAALVIECLSGRLELYVGFSRILAEAGDAAMVEYRLGEETTARKAVWDLSSDGRAIFARNAGALLDELGGVETFSLSMELGDRTRLTASFNLLGLDEALEPLWNACR